LEQPNSAQLFARRGELARITVELGAPDRPLAVSFGRA
jgi:hypothetical protein